MRALAAVALGVAAAVAALSVTGAPASTILPDDGGPIREVVLQYGGATGPDVLPLYADFLAELPADVTVLLAVPDEAALEEFRRAVPREVTPIVVGAGITSWTKDRCAVARAGGRTVLLVPDEPIAGTAARRNDWLVPFAIARAFPDRYEVRRLPIVFDGGDILASEDAVFISDFLFSKNRLPREELMDLIERATGREVVFLENAPAHHLGMYMMPVGGGRFVFASPRGRDERFESVRRQMLDHGYELIDAPLVETGGFAWITYTNVVIDGRRVHLPQYGDADLDAAARAAWTRAGFEVVPVDCGRIYEFGGSLRCLVNVLDRA